MSCFGRALDKVNSYNQGASSGGYTVRAGETLGSIAANLWGDSSLWYKLAQANGLSGEAALSEGQSLRIPAGVMKNTHNAATFKPYDPAETLGDTAPTAAKPPKKNKCGAFGQVLLLVVSTVVSMALNVLIPGSGNVFLAVARASFIGAASNAASQAVGVAFDIQQKFSWNQMAIAGISAGVTKGLEQSVAFNNAVDRSTSGLVGNAHRFAQAGIKGATANAITQGISVSAGFQQKFSWASVAAAGVGAGVGAWAGKQLGGAFAGLPSGIGAFASTMAIGTASAIADAATRTAFGDGNFGDNFRAAIPNVVAQAIVGAATSREVRSNPVEEQNARQANHASAQVRSAGGGANAKPGGEISGLGGPVSVEPLSEIARTGRSLGVMPQGPISKSDDTAEILEVEIMERGSSRNLNEQEITILTGFNASGESVGSPYTLLSRKRLSEIRINSAGGDFSLDLPKSGASAIAERTGNAVAYGARDIMFPSEKAKADFSTNVHDMAWLVHEVMHIWQYSEMMQVWSGAATRDYQYTIKTGAGHIIDDYGIEEQAAMMADLYYRENGFSAVNAISRDGTRNPHISSSTLRSELFMPKGYRFNIQMERWSSLPD